MLKKTRLFIIILFFSTCSIVSAQTETSLLNHHLKALADYADRNPIEKVHLQLDRPWYGLGDTIWFKAYTVIGDHHRLSALSGVLYVELISPSDSVTQRLILRLNSGTASGRFVVPYSLKPGDYRVRSYTNWMRNDDPAYFYDRQINIGGVDPQAQNTVAGKANSSAPDTNPQQIHSNSIDVQFFPEGGYLVNGLRSKVAFKAINNNGLATGIKGVIVDNDNNEVAVFERQHDGMGQFPLTPQAGKSYRAKITNVDSSRFDVALPKAIDSGFTLTINNAKDSVYVEVAANPQLYQNHTDTAFYLIGQSGGRACFTTGSKLVSRVFRISIPASRFPTGIARFTLFSQSGEPLNERVIFIRNSDDLLNITAKANKETYVPEEPVVIDLAADKAEAGSFSVAVTDETQVPVAEQDEPTIFTDLLLKSELKGNITSPNYYFTNTEDQTRSDLDLLMLTQGYRRFEWKKIFSSDSIVVKYKAELDLSVFGTIKTLSGNVVAHGRIKLTSIKDFFVADTTSDANGNFAFSHLDLDDSTKVVIDAKKAKGSNNVSISIKQPDYPPIAKSIKSITNYATTSKPAAVLLAQQKSFLISRQQSLNANIQLKEVKIKSHRNTYFNPVYSENMKFSSNLNGPGNANEVILSDKLMRSGSGSLSEILVGKTFALSFKNGLPYNNRNGQVVAVFVEGAQVSPDIMDDINPNDIYSIEILTSASYLSIYGSNAHNGALIITLKHGANKDTTKVVINGLITYNFQGFYKEKEFYSPKYLPNINTIPDERKTIYWNPNVITDKTGKASFNYFNAGYPGTYRVVIEGIDTNGNLARKVFRYKVE